jgi:hypothetical protein
MGFHMWRNFPSGRWQLLVGIFCPTLQFFKRVLLHPTHCSD